MNAIQGTKPARQQWNRILDVVVIILKYTKSAINHAIYTKVFYDGTVSYLIVSTSDVINTNRLGPAQDVHFSYVRSHLSSLQNYVLIFSTNFQLIIDFFQKCKIPFLMLKRDLSILA